MAKWIDTIARRLGYAKPQQRDFAAAAFNRLTSGWNSNNTSANVDLYRGLDTLRARSRDLFNNNDYARRFGGMVTANVVGGSGVMLQARIYDKPGKPDSGANDAVEIAFDKWGARGTCDVTGRLSWRDLQLLIIKAVARDGEALIRKIRGKAAGNAYGYALQVLDIDRLDTKLMRAADKDVNEIKMGVEVDAFGRAVAHWLRPYHPGELWLAQGQVLSEHQRVPAADILHVYMTDRPEALRGTPWMHAAMTRLNNLGGYEEAAVIAARVGASKMGFFKTAEGGLDAAADGKDAQGVPYTEAEPGAFGTLPDGMDFVPFNPDYPHAMYAEFVKACLRGVASGLGVSYHGLANDLEGVNFSSIRAGTLEERDQWIGIQQWFIDAFLEPVYQDWIKSALAFGQITLANGSPLPIEKADKFTAHTWQARRWQWVDPLKDMNASVLAIQNGLKAPQDVAAELGVDYEDVLVKIKQAQDLAAKIGVVLGKPAEPAPAPAEPDEDDAPKAVKQLQEQVRSLETRLAQPAAAPSITINQGAVEFKAGDTHVAAPAVQIDNHLPAPSVTIENRQDAQAAPTVEVHVEAIMPEQPAAVVDVTVEMPDELRITAMPTRETTSTVERNQSGEITRTTQTEQDKE
jgi:lambda family phage portal protein